MRAPRQRVCNSSTVLEELDAFSIVHGEELGFAFCL